MIAAAALALALAAQATPAAPKPGQLPPLASAPAAPRTGADAKRLGDWPAKPSGKTTTLDESMSIDDAVKKIAAAAGWNLVANTGRYGDRDIVVTVRSAPVEEALDAVLEGTPLVATRRGNTVTIAPGAPAPQPETPVLSGFDRPTGKRFTGTFNDAPVADALRKVCDLAGLSIVLPPGVRGTVTAYFKDAPVEDVLRAILSQSGLVAARQGSILTVSREGGPSLVIGGGKRRFTFNVPGLEGLDDRIQREMDRAQKEVDRAQNQSERPQGDTGRSQRTRDRKRGGDRVLRGNQVIGPGERAHDVVVLAGTVRLEAGAEAQQVTAVMGSVDLGPGVQVERAVVAVGGDIHVSPGARVGGDAVSVGGRIIIDEGGEVDGQQTSVDVPGLGGVLALLGTRGWSARHAHSGAWRVASVLLEFAVFFGLGLLAFVLFPRRVETLTGSLSNAPVKAVLTGILGTLALPIAAVLLVATVVGIPFVAVLALAVMVATVLGYTALALHFGRALPFRFDRGAPILQLALGTALLVAIGQIPILGWLAWMAAWLFIFGAVLRTRFGQPPHAPPPVYGTTAPPPVPPASPPPVAPPPVSPPAGS